MMRTRVQPDTRLSPCVLRPADLLTVARFALAVPHAATLWRDTPHAAHTATLLLLVGGLTDVLDGHVARATGATGVWGAGVAGGPTTLGAVLDPLADKALVDGALIALAHRGRVSPALAGVVVARDLAVTLLRAGRHTPVAPSRAAQLKTGMLFAALGIFLIAQEAPPAAQRAARAGLWLAAALSLASGAEYLRAAIWRPRGLPR
jgi:phosphatidylglycerophosphate synthase